MTKDWGSRVRGPQSPGPGGGPGSRARGGVGHPEHRRGLTVSPTALLTRPGAPSSRGAEPGSEAACGDAFGRPARQTAEPPSHSPSALREQTSGMTRSGERGQSARRTDGWPPEPTAADVTMRTDTRPAGCASSFNAARPPRGHSDGWCRLSTSLACSNHTHSTSARGLRGSGRAGASRTGQPARQAAFVGQKPLLHGRPSGVVAHGSAAADHSMARDEDGDLQDSEGHCQSVRSTRGWAH